MTDREKGSEMETEETPALRVEIEQKIGKPTRCKVYADEVLIFNGQSLDATVVQS